MKCANFNTMLPSKIFQNKQNFKKLRLLKIVELNYHYIKIAQKCY